MSSRQQVQTACQRCRQRRAKCNGEQPCSRCEQRGETCEYKSRQWVSKSELRAEIGRLRQSLDNPAVSQAEDPSRRGSTANHNAMQSWIDGVKSPDCVSGGQLPTEDAVAISSDSAPGAGGAQLAASSMLASTSSSTSCFDQLLSWRSCHPTFEQRNRGRLISSISTAGGLSLPSAPLDAYGNSTDLDLWTQIGWTRAHIRHLFDALITWDSVSFCILRKKEFLQDYETGSTRFCSSALVHALLAIATRLINEAGDDSHVLPSGWLGSKYFLHKADALLRKHGTVDSLPDIQSMGILALYHIRCGQEKEARNFAELCSAHIRSLCARESSTGPSDAEYIKVRATTYCGAISLLRMLHLTTGTLFNEAEPSQDAFILDQLPYTSAGASMTSPAGSQDSSMSMQLANPQVLIVKMFQLTEWVYKVIVAHKRAPGKGDILATYTKCLGWYRDVFELIGECGTRSPFIIFIHMYYHFCLLCAFRPFVGSDFADTEIQPHEMCVQAVESILALAQSYDDLFTLRRVSALVPYFVCASGLFSLAIEDSGSDMDFTQTRSQEAASAQAANSPSVNALGSSPATLPSGIRVSGVVQARLLLSKMSESHPAASLAANKLRESLHAWRQSGDARFN